MSDDDGVDVGDAPDIDEPGSPDSRPVALRLGLTLPSEVARAGLERAKTAARARGLRPGSPGTSHHAPPPEQRSGARRDGRDPALVGDTLSRLAAERGWATELSVGGVIGRWREVVGDQIADHCTPETFQDGALLVRTDSTPWATHLTQMSADLLARLATELGPDVVRELKVLGPTGPRWVRGPRSVPGRGPRDTYG